MATNNARHAPETVIEIPGEPDLFKTVNLPSEFVPLPLQVGARGQPMAILIGLFGALLLFGAVAALLGARNTVQSYQGITGSLALGLFLGAAGVCAVAAAATAMADLGRRFPLLILDADGILDKRSVQAAIAWSDIAHAKIAYTKGGVGGVRLKLRRNIKAHHNPFRLGTLAFSWWRRPDELHVPVMGLDAKPRAQLFEHHGDDARTRPTDTTS